MMKGLRRGLTSSTWYFPTAERVLLIELIATNPLRTFGGDVTLSFPLGILVPHPNVPRGEPVPTDSLSIVTSPSGPAPRPACPGTRDGERGAPPAPARPEAPEAPKAAERCIATATPPRPPTSTPMPSSSSSHPASSYFPMPIRASGSMPMRAAADMGRALVDLRRSALDIRSRTAQRLRRSSSRGSPRGDSVARPARQRRRRPPRAGGRGGRGPAGAAAAGALGARRGRGALLPPRPLLLLLSARLLRARALRTVADRHARPHFRSGARGAQRAPAPVLAHGRLLRCGHARVARVQRWVVSRCDDGG
ncbi:hypothetical protein T484DRAFT_2506137 [Baffinella frigidus]|nr:hypothetical protein T484DRAFT_2506137 [Cryptophyta sp. CCMP2293]